MLASRYDEKGPNAEVLRVGALPDPEPGPGEVRVRVTVSGVNPEDTKKRSGLFDPAMPYPRVVPHNDAAGVIDAVGQGVEVRRVGQRVWVYGVQSCRPFGTAAQHMTVPADFADGPVDGETILVRGVLGAVGSLAAQLASWGGATFIGTVRRAADLEHVVPALVSRAAALDGDDPVAAVHVHAPRGVDRIGEVSLSDNADLDDAIAANGAVIAACATRTARTEIPFRTLLFNNVTRRLIGSDDFPDQARRQAAGDLTAAASAGALSIEIGDRFPLQAIAKARGRVDAGGRGRVLTTIPH